MVFDNPIPPNKPVPVVVPMEDGWMVVVRIPRMTSEAYAFFLAQLKRYKPAIVREKDEEAAQSVKAEVEKEP